MKYLVYNESGDIVIDEFDTLEEAQSYADTCGHPGVFVVEGA